jgi:hypothetical protein
MPSDPSKPQAAPLPGDQSVLPLVLRDFNARADIGYEKYRRPLQTFNGRTALIDLYQELMDAVLYCRQQIEERASILYKIVDAISILENRASDPDMRIVKCREILQEVKLLLLDN